MIKLAKCNQLRRKYDQPVKYLKSVALARYTSSRLHPTEYTYKYRSEGLLEVFISIFIPRQRVSRLRTVMSSLDDSAMMIHESCCPNLKVVNLATNDEIRDTDPKIFEITPPRIWRIGGQFDNQQVLSLKKLGEKYSLLDFLPSKFGRSWKQSINDIEVILKFVHILIVLKVSRRRS